MENFERLLTVEQIADQAQVTKQTVYNLIRSGKIRAVRFGKNWRVKESALREYLNDDTSSDYSSPGNGSEPGQL